MLQQLDSSGSKQTLAIHCKLACRTTNQSKWKLLIDEDGLTSNRLRTV